jgi:hypothetical protein
MGQAQRCWGAWAKALPRKGLTGAIALVKKLYQKLKDRYGPRYTKAMVLVAFLALFSPVPGSVPVGVGLIVVLAEAHRAISRRGGCAEAVADLVLVVKANTPFWVPGRWRWPPC